MQNHANSSIERVRLQKATDYEKIHKKKQQKINKIKNETKRAYVTSNKGLPSTGIVGNAIRKEQSVDRNDIKSME